MEQRDSRTFRQGDDEAGAYESGRGRIFGADELPAAVARSAVAEHHQG